MKMKWKVVSPYTGIEEDAPASSVGGGNIAGLGVDHPDRPGSGEPGVDPKKKKKRPRLTGTQLKQIFARQLEPVQKTKARQCETCLGKGVIRKVKIDGIDIEKMNDWIFSFQKSI